MTFLVIFIHFSPFSEAQTPAADRILSFANHLFEEEDYYRAITEYERYAFHYPDAESIPHVKYQIARSYLYGEQFEQAFTLLSELSNEFSGQKLGRWASFSLTDGYYDHGNYQKALHSLQTLKQIDSTPCVKDAANIYSALCTMRLGDLAQATHMLDRVSLASPAHPTATELKEDIPRLQHLPYKNPWLAGTLSAMLPGAGQCYVERPRDALASFLLNGILIWATLESFDQEQYVAGSMLGLIELGWYSGNIYNAINSAHKFNTREQNHFFDNLELRFERPFYTTDALPTLSLNYHFDF